MKKVATGSQPGSTFVSLNHRQGMMKKIVASTIVSVFVLAAPVQSEASNRASSGRTSRETAAIVVAVGAALFAITDAIIKIIESMEDTR